MLVERKDEMYRGRICRCSGKETKKASEQGGVMINHESDDRDFLTHIAV